MFVWRVHFDVLVFFLFFCVCRVLLSRVWVGRVVCACVCVCVACCCRARGSVSLVSHPSSGNTTRAAAAAVWRWRRPSDILLILPSFWTSAGLALALIHFIPFSTIVISSSSSLTITIMVRGMRTKAVRLARMVTEPSQPRRQPTLKTLPPFNKTYPKIIPKYLVVSFPSLRRE